MRRAPVLLATILSALASAACSGGSGNCTPAYDYSLSVATSSLGGQPLCSKCGGPSENPSYECQSTCSSGGADGGEVTCIVDSCATAVRTKNVQCKDACSALFPGVTLNDTCSIASGTVTCSLHQDETCK